MAKRTVKVGVMSFVNADNVPQFALMGAEVEVHASDVDRFDRFNKVPGVADEVVEQANLAPASDLPTDVAEVVEDDKPARRRRS